MFRWKTVYSSIFPWFGFKTYILILIAKVSYITVKKTSIFSIKKEFWFEKYWNQSFLKRLWDFMAISYLRSCSFILRCFVQSSCKTYNFSTNHWKVVFYLKKPRKNGDFFLKKRFFVGNRSFLISDYGDFKSTKLGFCWKWYKNSLFLFFNICMIPCRIKIYNDTVMQNLLQFLLNSDYRQDSLSWYAL